MQNGVLGGDKNMHERFLFEQIERGSYLFAMRGEHDD